MSKTNKTNSMSYTTKLGGQHSVTGVYGWICPVCGRGVAPNQKYCNCKPQVTPIYPIYTPYPYWWYQVTCNTAGPSPDLKTTYTTSTSTKEV